MKPHSFKSFKPHLWTPSFYVSFQVSHWSIVRTNIRHWSLILTSLGLCQEFLVRGKAWSRVYKNMYTNRVQPHVIYPFKITIITLDICMTHCNWKWCFAPWYVLVAHVFYAKLNVINFDKLTTSHDAQERYAHLRETSISILWLFLALLYNCNMQHGLRHVQNRILVLSNCQDLQY